MVVGLFLFVLMLLGSIAPSPLFPKDSIFKIEQGLTLSEASSLLKELNIIKHELPFKISIVIFGGQTGVQAGDYYLHHRENTISLAWRIARGDHHIDQVRVTIPEGYDNQEISKLFDESFPLFDNKTFLSLSDQGYMFPDTYFAKVSITAEEAIEMLRSNFELRTKDLSDQFSQSKYSKEEIIIMASVLEGEVQTREDKELVAGLLWKRLKIGMALQVDSAPETYKEPGLPKEPINNPGLVSIESALNPKDSPYLYFISDKQGKTHYARTLDEHIANIQKYL